MKVKFFMKEVTKAVSLNNQMIVSQLVDNKIPQILLNC